MKSHARHHQSAMRVRWAQPVLRYRITTMYLLAALAVIAFLATH